MRRSEQRRVVSAYVTDRLREECKKRGKASEIARAINFTRVHVAAVARGDNAVGEDFAHAIARYWGMTPDDLDAVALRWADENGVEITTSRTAASGRLRERDEWDPELAIAKSFYKGIPEQYLERVGMMFDDVPQRIDAQFIGEAAKVLYDLARREASDPPESTAIQTSRGTPSSRKGSKQ